MKYTPNQQRAIETVGKHLCVDAGAGSGKTRVLVDRIVHLLEEEHATLDEIVAITFTRKAAAEMKDRLRVAFREKQTPTDARIMNFWRRRERQLDTAAITTIDSFCASLLREHALSLGLDPEFTMLADAESVLLPAQVARDGVTALLEKGDVACSNVSSEFGVQQVVEQFEKLLNSSRAVERAAQRAPVDDAKELLEAWRRSVEDELRERLKRFPRSPRLRHYRARLASFEGQCTKATDAREVARLDMIRIIDATVAATEPLRVQSRVEEMAGIKMSGTRKQNWASESERAKLDKLQTKVKQYFKKLAPPKIDETLEQRAAELTCDFYATFQKVAARYDAMKAERSALDFEDLLSRASRMLSENDPIRDRVASGIKHLLIDEFQDTNSAQLEMARALMRRADRAGAEHFIVGDAKQSIYGFRGAEVDVFDTARDEADEHFALEKNFRSVPEVLSFVDDFFAKSGLLGAVEPDYAGQQTHRDAANEARVEFLIPEDADGNPSAEDYRRAEAELIAARIAELCGPESAAKVQDEDSGEERAATFGDVAVLFRTSTHLHLYEEALRARGIEFVVEQGKGFYERQEIADLRNLLEAVLDPWNEMALLGFLRSPMVALSDESLMRLCLDSKLAKAVQDDRALDDPEQQLRLEHARTLLRDFRARVEQPLRGFLRHVLTETGYEGVLLAQNHGRQKAQNLRKLIDLAGDFSRTSSPRLAAFVDYLKLASAQSVVEGEAAVPEGARGVVRLMTIHKAKGLEFPIVIVADASQKRKGSDSTAPLLLDRDIGMAAKIVEADGEYYVPAIGELIKDLQNDRDEAEYARVLYVALTRARDWLLIGGSPTGFENMSWLTYLNDAYDLEGADDDAVRDEDGWSYRVLRKPKKARATKAPAKPMPDLDLDALLEGTRPVHSMPTDAGSISVSEVIGDLLGDPEQSEHTPWAAEDIDPLYRGTLAHRLLELWNFGDAPPIERVLREACPPLAHEETLRTYLSGLAETFAGTALYARLSDDDRLLKETPFVLKIDERAITGTIDALLSDGTIVDYKTGTPREQRIEGYEHQLRLYAEALRRLSGSDPQEALLFFIDAGETRAVDVSAQACEETLARVRETFAAPA